MNRRRLHRWWLLNAAWSCVLVVWESVLLVLGLHGAWLLIPTVPVTVVQFIGWRKTRPARLHPDYARIALLEHELLGIEPEPGTFAAAAVALQAFAPRSIRRDRTPTYFAGGYESSDKTIHDLPPFPAAMTEQRRAACQHAHPHTVALLNGHADTICLDCGISLPPKLVPPPGPDAGSATTR